MTRRLLVITTIAALAKSHALETAELTGPHRWRVLLPTNAQVTLDAYVPAFVAPYTSLCKVDPLGHWRIGSYASGGVQGLLIGFHTSVWLHSEYGKSASNARHLKEQVIELVNAMDGMYNFEKHDRESLLAMLNRNGDQEQFAHSQYRKERPHIKLNTA